MFIPFKIKVWLLMLLMSCGIIFAQPLTNLSGTPVTATALSCPFGGSPNATNFITTFTGYFGASGNFPKAGDTTTVFVNVQILGQPCGTLEGVYAELILPTGAEIAGSPQCFLNGQNVSSSSEFNCRVFNEASTFGGKVLGTNLLLGGQTFEIRMPVTFTRELTGGQLKACVQSASVDNFFGAVTPLCPVKSISVPYQAEISYPNPSATQISSTGASLKGLVKNNFKAGNAFVDFGTTQAYGSTSAALPIPATGDAFNVSVPLQNLAPGTSYHWRLRFVAGGQTFLGTDQVFSTSGATPPDPGAFILSVSKSGTGAGSLGTLPIGIACNASCSAASSGFASGTSVKLFATPAQGSTFVGWTGACSGSDSPCTLTMDAAKTVSAIFNTVVAEPQTHTLTVAKTGSGIVISQPSSLNCGSQCEAEFNDGVSVKLTATPSAGFTFTGWSGDCSGSAACIIPMTQDRSVSAVFSPIAEEAKGSLNITVIGLPQGALAEVSVKGPELKKAIRETTLLEALNLGEYTVSAAPVSHAGQTYQPQLATQVVTVTANSQAEATVTYIEENTPTPPTSPDKLSLQLVLSGSGLGKVTSTPGGLDCPTVCSSEFAQNTEITLSAVAQEGSSFTGWSGPCEGFGAICTFTLGASSSITASFTPLVEETKNQLELSRQSLAAEPDLKALSDVTLISFLARNTGDEALRLQGISLENLSSDNALADLKNVKLYVDNNQNQALDAEDSLLATVSSEGGAQLAMNLEGLELGAGESLSLLLAADFHPSLLALSLSVLGLIGLGFGFKRLRGYSLVLLLLMGLLLSSCNTSELPAIKTSKRIQLRVTQLVLEPSPNDGVTVLGLPLSSEVIELN
ncbi:MAG: hypothetical protein KC422_25235 [Trueperaceae bacterium]|nr:hypothetical protein [Trueperaceae bacterium]